MCVKWNGGGCLFSVTVRRVEGGRGRGRDRQTWLPPEQRLCSHCDLNQMETELHFLTECSKYTDIRTVYYDKIQQIHPTFTTLPDQKKLAYLLGEADTLPSHYYLLSPSTLFFLFLYILLFFAHLVVFLHIFLHILLSFAHLIVFCTSYCFALFFISLHILLLFLLFLPYVCPCVMLLYIICILLILHCPLSGPDSITFHF